MSDLRTPNPHPAVGSTLTAASEDRPAGRRASAASWAPFAVFAINGLVVASWTSRLLAVGLAVSRCPPR